jgi:hypothetical protein
MGPRRNPVRDVRASGAILGRRDGGSRAKSDQRQTNSIAQQRPQELL